MLEINTIVNKHTVSVKSMDQTCKYIVVEQIIENNIENTFRAVKTKPRDKNYKVIQVRKYKMSDNM